MTTPHRFRSARFVAVLLLASLGLTACEALDFLVDLYDVSDLTESDDPAIEAAGHASTIVQKIEQAETTVQEVLNGDEPPETLDDLRVVRPRDAKIANYVFWLAMLDGRTDLMVSASDAAKRLHAATMGTSDPATTDRRWLEQNLDVMSDIITTQAPGPDASQDQTDRFDRLVQRHCETLSGYRTTFGSQPEGQLYLSFANMHDCG